MANTGASRGSRLARGAALGALALGAVGFVCGFFGPIALSPEANQGPLLGIFITGPAGTFLGALLGAIAGALQLTPSTFRFVLAAAGTVVAAATLYFSLPEPQFRAGLLDAEIASCAPPSSRRDNALAYWDEVLASMSRSQARAGWKEDFDHMLATESAVVLRLRVLRRSRVYENRKPWNRGTLEARPWISEDPEQIVFATYAGGSCTSYPTGTRAQFLASGETSHEWPPEILANLLNLQTVEPAPERYRRLVAEEAAAAQGIR
jgi:hypothetical protein